MFTTRDKLACAERELKYRIRVYSRLVAEGKLTERQASREIAIMGAIADDYRALHGTEEPEIDFG